MIIDDPELRQEFLTETTEILEHLDNDLIDLESDPENRDVLNRIFRSVHTIKGTSGFLGFEQLVELGHAAEDVLDRLRKGVSAVTPEVMDVLLDTNDTIKVLVNQVHAGKFRPVDLNEIMSRLNGVDSVTAAMGTASEGKRDSGISGKGKNGRQAPESRGIGKDLRKRTGPSAGGGAKNAGLDARAASTVRIDVNRLEDMMNLVGELVLERNKLLQINRDIQGSDLNENCAENIAEVAEKINFITSELQLAVMRTRMIPLERIFRKFPRVVRDMARERKKEVEFLIAGGDTELDKTIVDQLGDSLIHLLRNAIDHGLETPECRIRSGKSRAGRIVLKASQEGNHILIRIEDDGRGIDIEKVETRALEREMITKAQRELMSPGDVMQLIFEPGFSTADEISDLSGRGVGMDVVKTNIRKLNGMIELKSEPGAGTEIKLKLPLTLAVSHALLVEVTEEIYAIPLSSVIETLRVDREEIQTIERREVIRHRDSVIPLIRLDTLFGIRSVRAGTASRPLFEYVVLVGVAEKRFGLIVDRLLGQEEIVIKSLGDYLANTGGVAGGTITGDGRVRLIVDCGTIADWV